jgi:hypothetical protein
VSILPKEKRKPISDVSQEIILLYGVPKIGKSSFAGQFTDALFISTEEGLNHLEVYESPVKCWDDFLKVVREIEAGRNGFKTVVIDTLDNLYMFCKSYIYGVHNINHESDLDWGRGWDEIEAEFRRQITRLSQIKQLGKIFVSHSELKEIKVKGKDQPDIQVTHTLPKRARKTISGMADMILYMETDGEGRRVIRTKPTTEYEAGDRTGRLPHTIYMGPSSEVAYKNFLSAYYGEGRTDADNEAREAIIGQIKKGLAYLEENNIDSFENETRRVNSFTKHLGCAKLTDDNIPLEKLQAYYQHLRIKGLDAKQNGEKKK